MAAVNGPTASVVSGSPEALDELAARCERDGIRFRRLPVDYASHSAQVERLRDRLLADLDGITPRAARIPLWSTATGDLLDTTGMDARYWYDNLRGVVRFDPVMRLLLAAGHDIVVEVSTHPVLLPGIRETAAAIGAAPAVLGTLRRHEGGADRFAVALAEAYVAGAPVDWTKVGGAEAGTGARVALPTHPFDTTRFWPTPGRRAATGPAFAPWRHVVSWRPHVAPATSGTLHGRWLVLTADELPAGTDELLTALRAAGAEPDLHRVPSGEVDPTLFDAPAEGVLSLLGLGSWDTPGVLPQPLAATLNLLQQATAATGVGPVWCVTSGAVESGEPRAAALWALGRVAGLEHPGAWGGIVDVPADRLSAVVDVLTGAGDEQEFAVRPEGVQVRRLVPAPPPTGPGREWQPRGTTLITGGTGAIGARVARLLATRGADHLLLLSRRGTAPGLAEELRGLGAGRVTVAAVDVADRAALAAVLAEVPADLPVRGVVHAAGVADDTRLSELDPARFAAAIAAKTEGARHLEELVAEPEVVVAFSSGAAVWGAEGAGAYAAGNAVLAAMTARQRARGIAATCVSWGSWGGGGMVSAALDQRLRRTGVRAMDPDLALAALVHAVEHDEAAVTVTDTDWELFARAYTAARPRPLIAELVAAPGGTGEESAGRGAELRQRLTGTEPGARERVLLDVVRAAAGRALGHEDGAPIAAVRAFRDLGMDSLTAVDLRNRLSAATGLSLRPPWCSTTRPRRSSLVLCWSSWASPGRSPMSRRPPRGPPDAGRADRHRRHGLPLPRRRRHARRSCGSCSRTAGTPSASSPPTAAGTWSLYDPTRTRRRTRSCGRLPRRRGRVRRRVLRHLAARGAGHGPAAAPAAGDRLGGHRARRHRPGRLRGSDTGVFVGSGSHDYADLLRGTGDGRRLRPDRHRRQRRCPAGSPTPSACRAPRSPSTPPARRPWWPCTSPAQALRAGECDLALAGGVTVMSTPDAFDAFRRQRGLAADGRCKAFGADADGTGWAEGVGVLLRGAVVGCAAPRSSGSGGGSRFGGESGWRVEWFDCAEWPAQQRVIRRRWRRRVCPRPRSMWWRRMVRVRGWVIRSRREALLATYGSGARDRPLLVGFGEVEHRSYAGCRGRGRCDQDGAGYAARRGSGVVACVERVGSGAVDRRRRGGFRGHVVGVGRCASGGCVGVRDQRHQRARHHRASSRT